MILKEKQKGIALISALTVSTVVILVTGGVVYQVIGGTKDIVRIKNLDAAESIANEGTEQIIDWMNQRNNPDNYNFFTAIAPPTITQKQASRDLVKNITSSQFISPLNSMTTVDQTYLRLADTAGQLPTSASAPVGVTPASLYKIITNSATSFPRIAGARLIGIQTNSSSIIPELTANPDPVKILTFSSSGTSDRLKGEFDIGVTPITPPVPVSPRYDLIEMVSVAYVPSRTAANKTVRKFVSVIQRPKDLSIINDTAILANSFVGGTGIVDSAAPPFTLRNLNTNPMTTAEGGGVGNVTSNTSINSALDVFGVEKIADPDLPIPVLDYRTATTNPSSLTLPDCSPVAGVYTGPCKTTSLVNNAIIKNDVYLNGDLTSGGISAGSIGTSANPSFDMLIVSGDVSLGGNDEITSNGSTQQFGIVVTGNYTDGTRDPDGGDIDIGGNASIYALVANYWPTGITNVNGSGNGGGIFGGLISIGIVDFSGNHAPIIKNNLLTNPPYRLTADAYSMRVLSTKEIK